MNVKRMIYATSVAAAVGLAGVLGTGITTANAAPVVSTGTHPATSATQQSGPKVKLTHHQRKELLKQDKKELKKPQQVIAR